MLDEYISMYGYVPLEVELKEPDDFLKIKETLTRMGVLSKRKNKTLYQSAHILHKKGRYFIVHFKELFALDGKETSLDENDIERRNTIGRLLKQWGLLTIVNEDKLQSFAPLAQIKIIPFKEKRDWNLEPKYTIGGSKQY